MVAGCAPAPGSLDWCEAKKKQPTAEWSVHEVGVFAAHCVIEDLAIGSEAWCNTLGDTAKSEWTADDAKNYARYCLF